MRIDGKRKGRYYLNGIICRETCPKPEIIEEVELDKELRFWSSE